VSFEELRAWPKPDLVVLDTREPVAFAAGHLSGSLNVGLAGRFAEYGGDVIRPDQRILLVCEPGREVEAKVRLGRIGDDHVVGYLVDPMRALVEHPEIAERSSRLSASELSARRTEIPELVVVDVRNPGELERGVLPVRSTSRWRGWRCGSVSSTPVSLTPCPGVVFPRRHRA